MITGDDVITVAPDVIAAAQARAVTDGRRVAAEEHRTAGRAEQVRATEVPLLLIAFGRDGDGGLVGFLRPADLSMPRAFCYRCSEPFHVCLSKAQVP